MWQNLSNLSLSPLNLFVRAMVVYLAVLILLRISGKKQMGQMGATEFVAILITRALRGGHAQAREAAC